MAPAFYVPGDYQHELRVLLTGRFATSLCYITHMFHISSIISIKVFAENLKVCALYTQFQSFKWNKLVDSYYFGWRYGNEPKPQVPVPHVQEVYKNEKVKPIPQLNKNSTPLVNFSESRKASPQLSLK